MQVSSNIRGEIPLLISEIIATFGLIITILFVSKYESSSVATAVALFITAGYAHQMKPSCEKGIDIKYVPRNVYDEIMQGKPYSEETTV